MRKTFCVSIALLSCGDLLAETVTLPAAAAIAGGAPFFSDVRAFNTSYTSALNVTATYRCFLGARPSNGAQTVFTLSPREARAFDDMVASSSGFNAPNSAGGVEFSFTGESEQLVVTSRLFSTAPVPTVGMFIPGLGIKEAYPNTVLTSVRNAGSGAGFRTNVGVFNPGDTPVSVTFTIVDDGAAAGRPVTVSGGVGAHTGTQVDGIFNAAGVRTLSTGNGVVRVTATGPILSYAAVIDNATTDPYLVVGAEDQPPQPVATATPTPPGPTPTPPGPAARTVNVSSFRFTDLQSGTSTTTIHVGDTVMWQWVGGFHSTTAGPCPPCNPSGTWNSGDFSPPHDFSFTFNQAGTFHYYCDVHLASMTGTVIVTP